MHSLGPYIPEGQDNNFPKVGHNNTCPACLQFLFMPISIYLVVFINHSVCNYNPGCVLSAVLDAVSSCPITNNQNPHLCGLPHHPAQAM